MWLGEWRTDRERTRTILFGNVWYMCRCTNTDYSENFMRTNFVAASIPHGIPKIITTPGFFEFLCHMHCMCVDSPSDYQAVPLLFARKKETTFQILFHATAPPFPSSNNDDDVCASRAHTIPICRQCTRAVWTSPELGWIRNVMFNIISTRINTRSLSVCRNAIPIRRKFPHKKETNGQKDDVNEEWAQQRQ